MLQANIIILGYIITREYNDETCKTHVNFNADLKGDRIRLKLCVFENPIIIDNGMRGTPYIGRQ